MKLDVVILAARANTGKLSEVSNEPYEANIEIAGKPMVSYVLSAFSGSSYVNKIFLVGPEEALSRYESDKVTIVEPGQDLFENVKIGLSRVTSEFCIVSSSDIPLITVDIVDQLITRCLETGADFCYPVSRKETCEKKYPGVKRTYVRIKDGTFTGGNVFFVRKSIVGKTWPLAEKMIAFRKAPLKMASYLGFGLLIKVALGVAGVSELEKRVGDLLQIKPRAILDAAPEIGIDVDKPSDYQLASSILGHF